MRTSNGKKKRERGETRKTGKVSPLISAGLSLFGQGRLAKAKKVFEKANKMAPLNADVLYHLGVIAREQGRIDESKNYYEKVISIDPEHVNSYFNLACILLDQKKYDEAIKYYEKSISLQPDCINAYYNLGIIEGIKNNHEKAISYYEKVVSIDPNYTNAYHNIGCILISLKKYNQAIELFKKTVLLDPSHLDGLFNLGYISMIIGKNEEAIRYYESVLSLNPRYVTAYNNLGLIFQKEQNLDKAAEYYERAVALDPEYSDAYLNLGNVFRARGDCAKATEYYAKSLEIKQSLVGLVNQTGLQKELCNYEEAYDLTLKVLEYENLKKSDLASAHDTFIQLCDWDKATEVIDRFRSAPMDPDGRDVLAGSFMEFCGNTDLRLDEIACLHKEWGRLTEQGVIAFEHDKRILEREPGRKLKIGYLSPDLREHSVGYLIKDIITHHNSEEFEIFCYGNFDERNGDGFTQAIKNSCRDFKYVFHLSDHQLAQVIFHDEIDILIELAGHTAGHRLRALAKKPAPIQITYLGYPNTTGLSRIDYRISDRFAESGPDKDYRYSEELIRLTNCFLTFDGFGDVVPIEWEQKRKGEVIFGCFNNLQKLTPLAITLWSRILEAVYNSRFHLKAKQLNTKMVWENIVKEFGKHGVPEHRLRNLGYTPTREEHLRLYNHIDVALDTFPYNGTVTTLEALWMNVPVVTLVGESHAQRVGYSILKNLDLEVLVAHSEDEYVAKAIDLATNPEMVFELKSRMRKNLLASPICNPQVTTREIELRLKKIWMEYVKEQTEAQGSSSRVPGSREMDRRPPESLSPTKNPRGRDESGGVSGQDDPFGHAITAASKLRVAMVKLREGEFRQAMEISRELLDLEGISPLAWYVLGLSHYRLGENEQAIEALEHSLKLDPKNAGAWKVVGEIHLVMDEIEQANTCLKTIAELKNQAGANRHLAAGA